MRYMMLIYAKETEVAKQSRERMKDFPAAHRAIMEEARRQGVFRGSEALEHTATATTVRIQNGKVLMTDGPFAETKEQLAGYYILDCKDLDEALEWAARIRTACGEKEYEDDDGCVEVRPIHEIPTPVEHSRSLG